MNRFYQFLLEIGRNHRAQVRRTEELEPLTGSDSSSILSLEPPFEERRLAEIYTPREILHKTLSTDEYLLEQAVIENEVQDGPKQIGEGQCGTVWSLGACVLKLAKPGKDDQLWNECIQHKRVVEAFQEIPARLRKHINVPRWENWVQPGRDRFWKDQADILPQNTEPTFGILSTRILPLSPPVREALFDRFAPEAIKYTKAEFLATPENNDCLVRLYLGRRATRSSWAPFKLRDFDLTASEMESLGLDLTGFANTMAYALAVLHWRAGVDGTGVEFVLGRAPATTTSLLAEDLANMKRDSPDAMNLLWIDYAQRSTGMWLLDFDQCQAFPNSNQGITQLQRAFDKAPYYPHPESSLAKDVALWSTFKATYVDTSENLKGGDSRLPQQFIAAVEFAAQQRARRQALSDETERDEFWGPHMRLGWTGGS